MLFSPTSPGVKFLGKTVPLASSAANTPTIVFGPGYEWLIVYHFIAGYTSGGGIARLQLGTASSVDTGNNYSWLSQNASSSTTYAAFVTTASTAGVGVARTSTTNGRRGVHEIWNPTTDPKFIESRTITFASQTPASAAATHTSIDWSMGNWWQNSEAQCIRMDGGGSVSLLTGSYISVYGLPRIQ